MKKLLQINSLVNSGSTGRIAEEIGQMAMAVGWESYIAYGRNNRPSQSKLIKIGSDLDIKMHGLQTRLFDRHGLGSKSATRELVEKIEKIKPDIIHLHNIHGYYINIEILFKYLQNTNIPVVWTLHDCWPITGHCSYFSFVGCDKWKTQCFSCPQKTDYPASWFIDRSEKNFNLKKKLFTSLPNVTLVPVSNWLSGILEESFLQNYPLKVIHNGINTEVFRPSTGVAFRIKHSLENKFILLGVASVWSPRKRMKDFIALSKLLNNDFQIVLVGLTRKQIEQLPDSILGVERTESMEELAEIYVASDVYVNPTYEDNFPTTNLESLACGTPVITYKTGGSPEAIDDLTGIVVEQGNINKLVEAINQIKEKGKEYYTEACVERVHRLYRKEDRYREYIELYESLL
jgi:glycosyltransferase involved in cell wall biosynthesis